MQQKLADRIRSFWWQIKYEHWPPVKVRSKYYYWIVRYGGKKRIPKEVVFGAMAKSLQRMNENLDKAFRAAAEDPQTSGEGVHQVLAVKNRAKKLEQEIDNLR